MPLPRISVPLLLILTAEHRSLSPWPRLLTSAEPCLITFRRKFDRVLKFNDSSAVQRDTDASGEPLHPALESWLGHSAKKTPQTVFETWQNQHRRSLLQTAWLERWQATATITGTGRPIDGLIMPSTPFPAVRHDAGYPYHWGPLPPLLDLTAGVFPVTTVDLEKDIVPADWTPISYADKKVMEYYGTPKNHENAPVGLAVVGRRLEEEKVTAMLQVISDALTG